MLSTTLERLLTPERERRRTDETSKAGFAVPAMGERPLDLDAQPLLVTNMRGDFVPTRVSQSGIARFGICECLPDDEGWVLANLFSAIEKLSGSRSGLAAGTSWMGFRGMEPRHLVVPYDWVSIACGREVDRGEADRLMSEQGFLLERDGLAVIVAEAPANRALLVAAPSLAGYYTRVDDRLGVTITRADSTFCLLDEVA